MANNRDFILPYTLIGDTCLAIGELLQWFGWMLLGDISRTVPWKIPVK